MADDEDEFDEDYDEDVVDDPPESLPGTSEGSTPGTSKVTRSSAAKAALTSSRSDNSSEYVVLEVIQMPEGKEDGVNAKKSFQSDKKDDVKNCFGFDEVRITLIKFLVFNEVSYVVFL